VARAAILDIEQEFETQLSVLQARVAHLPSRVRSLLWVVCAIPVLRRLGKPAPDSGDAVDSLIAHLPGLPKDGQALRRDLAEAALERAI
jgi:hypothetical protein